MRRRLLDNTYKKTVTGNPAIARSVARMHPDISFPGKTEQQQTTGAQLVDKIIIGNVIQSSNGNVICTVEENGIRIKTKEGVDKTNDSDIYFYGKQQSNSEIAYDECLKPGTYTMYAGISNKNFTLYVVAWRNNLSVIISSTINSIITFRVLEGDKLRIFIRPNTYEIVDVLIPYIINEGSTSKSYELYTGGKPSPSPEYPQDVINTQSPVQLEISDGGENIQTVTITSERPITKWDKLVKQNGVWGWLYQTAYIESYNGEKITSEWQSTTGELSTGATVQYKTSPEFIPLTEDEQQAMKALYTFSPTTVVQNSIGTEITLDYKTKRSLEVNA